jgi:hypothetical protein
MTDDAWPGPDSLDATVAAPGSHRVLLENEFVRVVAVTIAPGVREPVHTHCWSSVMLIDGPARIRYYGEDGSLEFESPETDAVERLRTEWLNPEGPHAVENIDSVPYQAVRVELKRSRRPGGPRRTSRGSPRPCRSSRRATTSSTTATGMSCPTADS